MDIGILGTGAVGATIGTAWIAAGHRVRMGSRTAANPRAGAWVESAGEDASAGTFADAAGFGEMVVNCTAGGGSLEAVTLAGAATLEGKVLVDVSNPLDFSHGMPPRLSVLNDDSLAEQIQRAVPAARVVKALNTIAHVVMVAPSTLPGDHVTFVCGDDAGARASAAALVGDLGWRPEQIVDLGDLTAARGLEMYLPLWLRLMQTLGTGAFNIAVVR